MATVYPLMRCDGLEGAASAANRKNETRFGELRKMGLASSRAVASRHLSTEGCSRGNGV
jgi:hypothetical protein